VAIHGSSITFDLSSW